MEAAGGSHLQVGQGAASTESEGQHGSQAAAIAHDDGPVMVPGNAEGDQSAMLEPHTEHSNGGGKKSMHGGAGSVSVDGIDLAGTGAASAKKESVSMELLKGAMNFAYAFGAGSR